MTWNYDDPPGGPYRPEVEVEEEEKYWTARRVVFIIVILITLVAFLVYSLSYLFAALSSPPTPQPPVTPAPLHVIQVLNQF